MMKIKAAVLPIQNSIVEKISGYLDNAFPIFFFVLANSFYLKSYDSAMIKITELQIFGTILIALWLCKVFESGYWPFKKNQTLIVLPFLAILLSGVISMAMSPLPLGSLDFFIRRVIYVGLALIAISELNSLQDFRRMTRWMVFTVALCTIYGLIQYIDVHFFPPGPPTIGLDKFVWRGAFGSRIFSTFGNPNFFSNFLVILVPILAALYLKSRQFYLLPLIALSIANIYWTGSKGPLVGLIAGTAVFAFLIVRFFVQSRKIKVIVFSVALSLVLTLGTIVANKLFYSGTVTSFSFRNYTWLSTFEMVKANPVLGNGIGTFWVTYSAYRRPAIFHVEGKHNTETDHAENEHLEVWMDEGTVGFGLWIWMIAMISVGIYKALGTLMKQAALRAGPKNKIVIPEEAYYMLGLFSGFLGMLIHNNSDVSMRFVSSGTPFWILAGMNAALVIYAPLQETHHHLVPSDDSDKDGGLKKNFKGLLRIISLLVVAVVAVRIVRQFDWAQGRTSFRDPNEIPHFLISWGLFLFCWGLGVWWFGKIALKATRIKSLLIIIVAALLLIPFWGIFMGDVSHNRAIFLSKNSIWFKSPEYDSKVLTFPPEYQMMYGGTPSGTFDKDSFDGKILGFLFPDMLWRRYGIGGALEHYKEVTKLRPDFIMSLYFTGNVYSDAASQSAARSHEAFSRGDTAQGEIYRRKTEEYFDLSLKAYADTRKLGPNYVQMHHQVGNIYHERGDFLNNLAPFAEHYGRKDLAEEYKKKSVEYWNKSIEYYHLYYKIDPVFDQNFYRLAQVYIQLGNVDQAEQTYLDHIEAKECKKKYHRLFGGFVKPNSITYPTCRYDIAGIRHTHDVVNNAKPEVWEILGDFYSYTKPMVPRAERCYLKGVELYPTSVDFQKRLASFYQRVQQPQKAMEVWKTVQKLAPQDPDVLKVFHP